MAQLTLAQFQAGQERMKEIRSKRWRILEGLRYILTTIQKSAGYTQDVMTVKDSMDSWRDVAAANSPALFVIFDRQRLVKHAGTVREYVMRVSIFGALKDLSPQQVAEFHTDLEECIYDNNTIFGECNKIEVPDIATSSRFARVDGFDLFEFGLDVEYTRHARRER